jgi:transcriptional regulator with XRE-family HTH domain
LPGGCEQQEQEQKDGELTKGAHGRLRWTPLRRGPHGRAGGSPVKVHPATITYPPVAGGGKFMEATAEHPDVLRLVVLFLRNYARMSQVKLGQAARMRQSYLSDLERGDKIPSEEVLRRLAAAAGFPWPLVAQLRRFYAALLAAIPQGAAFEKASDDPRSLALADSALLAVHAYLIEDVAEVGSDLSEQLDAERTWAALAKQSRARRRRAIEISPRGSRSWALARHLCHESEREAANDAQEALDLADLALWIAERVEERGEEFRSRLRGYAWGHKGSALRAAGHLSQAAEAFARALQLWKAGAGFQSPLLPEWRMLSLEASLRREEHRFAEALELLARAEKCAGGEPAALATVLLKKEFAYEQMGDLKGALATLAEAAPFVEASGDVRLLSVLRFETVKDLCVLERYDEAEALLPAVRDLAEQLGNALDKVRVGWLAARVAAGQGRREEAIAGLEKVRREFTDRPIPYDAALSSLELSVLYLEEGRTGEVKTLALEMGEIFKSQGIAREALASLKLFSEAAQKETATVELVKRVIAEVEGARRKTPPSVKDERG